MSVSYENNTASDVGTYTAVASFEIDTGDYSVPEPMSLEWSIGKADMDIRRLSWDYYQPFTYDGTVRTVKLKGVPENMEVVYSGNEAVDTGRYIAHAELRPASPGNFNTPEIADCEFEIVKADYDMSDVRWEGEREFVYDGTEKSVTLAGVPEGIEVVYTGNKATGAGDYVASAELVCDETNYNKPSVPDCSWHIDKAEYDMSGAAWQIADEYTYDGSAKSVELTGLPEGVRAVYSGNTATDVGEYEASAEFEYDSDNYIAPQFGAASWNIGPAAMPVDLQTIRWDYDGPFVYDGEIKGVTLAETRQEQGFFDRLRGRKAEMRIQGVPAGFEVVYDNNSAKDAGVYYATATLISMGDTNYKPLELPKCKWEIVKAPIDMSGVSWDYDAPFTFDGEEKSVELTGLPDTVEVTYTNNKALNAGGYEAMAEVTAKDPDNYEAPAPVSACWWHIDKAVYDMSEVRWTYEEDLIYNGKEKSVRIQGLPEGVRVEAYRGNKAIEAGSYLAEAKLRYRNKENYVEPIAPECKWKIEKKKIDTSEARWDYDEGTLIVYDGKPKEVKLVGVPKDVEVVSIDNRKINAVTYTAKARLSYDTANCEAEEIPDLKWTVEKASYDTGNVHWIYERPFEYDGKSKSISLANVPSSIGVRYRDNKASAVGTYTAKAYLTYDSDNFAEPDIDTSIDWSIVRKLED